MHPNSTKRTKTSVLGLMGWTRYVRCEKFRRDFVARTFALVRPIFVPIFVTQPNSPKCTQIVRNAPKHHFTVEWGGSGASVVKIPTRLRGTNFCTSSEHFAPSFVRQSNGRKYTQTVETHQNMSLGTNRVDRVGSLRKILMRLHGTNFRTCSARFAQSFVSQPNGPKCTQIARNAPNKSV